ncbi:lipopolysaccharide biosynthesis protein [Candidatus Nitrospira allomarina]|jgi:O-antigen/teichoic acid export membrane protein|uniref:Oligosaccharide flippase family protein n=1 Tax=Candidatus Nitrospira allomarina TaxID=3020900 RepID=A0AA96GDJ9_9BACT|nr:oligosaccharide flippase family protein [Candidatus Nitrospira allomarina]WNM57995.1 oligosaccharide flippase family protein [Candidatus Nitrospira allomarina]
MAKTALQYLSGVFWVGSGNLLGMVAALMTMVMAARLTTKEELGVYFLVMMVSHFAAIAGDLGLRNTATKMLSSSEPSDVIETARFFVTIAFISSMMTALVVMAALPFLETLWPYPEFRKYAWLGVPLAFLAINFQMVNSLLVGAGKFRELSALGVGAEILRAVFSVSALLYGLGVAGLLWGMILSRVFGIGIAWRLLPDQFGLVLRHPAAMRIIKFGGWMYGCSLLSVVMVKASDTILVTYLGTATLAIFSTSMQLPSALLRLFDSIRPVLLGYASSRESTGTDLLVESIRIGAGLLAVAATVLIGIADPLMTILFSSAYSGGINIMQALCAWAALSIVNYYFSINLVGTGHPQKAFVLIIPQVLISIGVALLLVPTFQGLGAAMALVITSLVGNFIGAWVAAGRNGALFLSLNASHLRAAIPLLSLLIGVSMIDYSGGLMMGMVGGTLAFLVLLRAVTYQDARQLYWVVAGRLEIGASSGRS